MKSAELRALQAPFKEKYRADPASALGTLTARGIIDFQNLTCAIDHQGPPHSPSGMHPRTGGDGKAACPAEMLLESLAGCAGVTFAAVCTAMELPIAQAHVCVEGDIDFRGTLGVSREVPVGFQSIRLRFEVVSEADPDKLAKAVELAERYCVVAQSLRNVNVEWKKLQ
jgi:uncharacterized OsmC-like protein